MANPEIKVVPDLAALTREAAERFVDAAGKAIQSHGAFRVALSGGSTPKPVYALLADEPYRSQVDWEQVRIFFGDERCVAPDSDQSNWRMANEALLSKVPVPASNLHRIRGEIDPQQAAVEYGQVLKDEFGDSGLDLAYLGMGPDGHTASLFPGTSALKETRHRCVANFVPKFNSWRVTMTALFLNRSSAIIFLVAGADKVQRIRDVLEGPRDPDRLPSQLINPETGRLTWLLDSAAAGVSA